MAFAMKSLDELEREINSLCDQADGIMKFQDLQMNIFSSIFSQEQVHQQVKSTPIKYKEQQQILSNLSTEASVKSFLQPQLVNTVNKFDNTGHK
ncbi:hypothetical protein TTHERM_00726410 (macronuclear) [Tetrahymena thermophila SB210]|uniref:Uncharacterized protein n=1 Tax=Tetrahymena thermophila (strain SB210) TaxID=312017 RepID=Q24GF0_TETTS|nr:hypothetical protein TTHERM_00726410 [Tetrahymena thermophila SB210]EAS06921.1 hypothetical protein TTHERM_00726410 [Tetrahymena thermophila SB210]|eukprot:XP_001027163.1 hypothetical protein TTHERM_00726410 [Tetrahymena thermophila SB210]